jgi:AcrR family transcriptional regulator/DNA-binding MarR family transcriptional regulator
LSLDLAPVQRARILGATLDVLDEHGTSGLTVTLIVGRAGVSRRTFYEQFSGCEDCVAALFEDALARARQTVQDALTTDNNARRSAQSSSSSAASSSSSSSSSMWRGCVRAGLGALLDLFDAEPALGSLLVVDALAAGPRVLQRRAHVLQELATILEQQAQQAQQAQQEQQERRRKTGGSAAASRRAPSLTAEGIVGAVLAVIHRRILERDRTPLSELLNSLMSMIVLPYLGRAAAQQELIRAKAPSPSAHLGKAGRPPGTTTTQRSSGGGDGSTRGTARRRRDPLEGLQMRLTYRTLVALRAIADAPGASNRQIADAAGIHDQGQISKLLHRLQRLGLIHNNNGAGPSRGEPNAWTLTPRGTEIQDTIGLTPDEAATVAVAAAAATTQS